ncbi:MAG: MFS transporter, partial [Saprospiraceae bacterium]|nr:MFS transporter [Saprospiraceae bacterium]
MNTSNQRSLYKVGLIILIFFVISFLTNILGALNPSVSRDFNLSETMSGFLPFSFFIAYGLMSIPSGILLERYKEKKMLIVAFLLSAIGSIIFVSFPGFRVFLVSLFTIGTGLAMLQVIINPLLRVSGGEENYAFYSVMAQLVFGLASFVSPLLYSWVVTNVHSGQEGTLVGFLNNFTPEDKSWVALYLVFALISLLMILLILATRFSKVELKEDEKAGTIASYLELFKNKTVVLYFLGIFAYVGSEQGISYWMSKFLSDFHGFDFETSGASAVSYFWGLMTVGGILGLVLLKLLDSKVVLRWFTLLSIISLILGLFGPADWALYLLPATGFFMSVMYPIIISLALNSVDKNHGSFAGILMTGIMGGAVVQLLIGGLADVINLKIAMLLNVV